MHTWSLHYPSFFGSFAKHPFILGYVWYVLGSFHEKRPCIFQACAGCILSITKPNHVNALCLSCLMLDQAPHTSSQAQAYDSYDWNFLAQQLWILDFCRDMKPLPAFYNELRGQTFVHCDTSEEYTRGLSTSTRPDLVVPTADTVLTDGRTNGEKKVRCPLVRTGPNWTDISVLWTLFSVLSDAVRTALGTKKVRLKFELCMFALSGQIFPGIFVTKIEQCTRMSATECWDLPSCVQKWKSKARPRIKARKIETVASNINENQCFGNLFSCAFNHPKPK